MTCKCFRTSIQEILSKDFFLCGWMHNKLLLHTYVCQGSASKKICMYVAQSTLNHFILHYFEFLNHVCLLHIVYKFTSDDSCGSYSEIQPHLKIGIIKCISTLSKYHRAISKFKKSAILHSMKDHPNSSKTFICFLRTDFHNEVSSFSWCLIGTFPWRNCSV